MPRSPGERSYDDPSTRVGDLFAKAVEQQVAEDRSTNRHLSELTDALTTVRTRIEELQGQVARDLTPVLDGLTNVGSALGALRDHMSAQSVTIRAELQEEVGHLRSDLREALGGVDADIHEVARGLTAELRRSLDGLREDLDDTVGGMAGVVRDAVARTLGATGPAPAGSGPPDLDPQEVARDVAARVSERVVDEVRGRIAGRFSEEIAGRVAGVVGPDVAERVTGAVAEEVTRRLDGLAERVAERMAGHAASAGPRPPGQPTVDGQRLAELSARLDHVADRLEALDSDVRSEVQRALSGYGDPMGEIQKASDHLAHLDSVLVEYLDMRERRVRRERDAVLHEVLDHLLEGLSDRQRRRLVRDLDIPPRPLTSQSPAPPPRTRSPAPPAPPGSADTGAAGSWRPAAAWQSPEAWSRSSPQRPSAPAAGSASPGLWERRAGRSADPARGGTPSAPALHTRAPAPAPSVGDTPAPSVGDTPAPSVGDTGSRADAPAGDAHVCDVCGFVAKSAGGLGSHKRVHR